MKDKSYMEKEKDPHKAAEKEILPLVKESLEKAAKDSDRTNAFRLMEFFRKECQFEMNLIGVRITWLLAVQAFLVTASALTLANALGSARDSARWLGAFACCICVIGMTISYRTIAAVRCAKVTLDFWHARVRMLFEIGQGLEEMPEWMALILARWKDPDDRLHNESLHLSNVLLPWVFICFWIALFCFALFLMLHGLQ